MEERKSVGEILSQAVDVIVENPILVVLYVIPVVLVLAGIAIPAGAILREGLFTGFEFDPEYFLYNLSAFLGIFVTFGILALLFGIVAAAFAITITYNALQGKKITLSEAWSKIGIGKIVLLVIAWIIWMILFVLGFFFFCIGALLVAVLLAFVRQGLLIDDLDLGAAFTNSYNIAKVHFFDVLIILLALLVLEVVLSLIPWIGEIMTIFVNMYGTVAITILYLNRK